MDLPGGRHSTDKEPDPGLFLICHLMVGRGPQCSMGASQGWQVRVEAGQGGPGPTDGWEANGMQNNVQMNTH